MNRSVLVAAGVLVGLLAFAGPAVAGSVRLETIREHGSTGTRVVYEGDARDDYVTIALARTEDLKDDSSAPRTIIGFLVTDLGPDSPGPGCTATGRQSVYLCRVSSDTRLLGPRMYGRGGADTLEVDVPRPGGVVAGGSGSDELWGPYEDDGETQVPIELHGGPGSDRLEATGRLYGGPGDDRFEMSSGASRLIGGAGDDQMWGSPRADFIDAGPGRDVVYADTGNDVVLARDKRTDVVSCDEGRDRLVADGRDESDDLGYGPFADCEALSRRGEPLMSLRQFDDWQYERYVTFGYGCPPDGPARCTGSASLKRNGRLIARRAISAPAGDWGWVRFRLGERRIRALLDTDLRVTLRWRDRSGHRRARSGVTRFTEVQYAHAVRLTDEAARRVPR